MLTLQDIQKQAYETAYAKGWHERPLCVAANPGEAPIDPDYDRILGKHALIHTELAEAEQCFQDEELALHYVDDKPEGFVVEVADAIIRIADTTQALGVPLDITPFTDLDWQTHVLSMAPATQLLAAKNVEDVYALRALSVRRIIDRASEALRDGDWAIYAPSMTVAILHLASICAGLGLDLEGALKVKMEFNRGRPHRHGGKRA